MSDDSHRSPLERAVAYIGRGAAWFTVGMVGITFGVVVLRYGFNLGWVWLQESVTYLHAAVFMLAAAWAWQEDGHVRVDIFYRDRSERSKAVVNALGIVLFVIPLCIYLIGVGWDYVAASWRLREGSAQAGGLQGVFLLKTLLVLMPALVLTQALCFLPRHWRTIMPRSATGS